MTSNELLDFKADGTFHRGDSDLTPGVWYYAGCTLVVTIDGPKEFEFIAGTSSLAATVGANTWTITKSGAGVEGYCEVVEPLSPCDGTFDPSKDYKFCYSNGVTSNELLDFKADGTFLRGNEAQTPGLWYYDGCTLIVTINGPKEFEFIAGTSSL